MFDVHTRDRNEAVASADALLTPDVGASDDGRARIRHPLPEVADDLVGLADELHASIGHAIRRFFAVLAAIDHVDGWSGEGARDMAHWIQMRYGISAWKAYRWLDAARAFEHLPAIAEAVERGELSVDKAVELTRFASPETAAGLVAWAATVSAGAIRRRAELETRRRPDETSDVERSRRLRWWLTDEGRRLELMAELPAADGALVVGAIERAAADLPELPEHDRAETVDARRADALVAICTGADRATDHRSFRAPPRTRIVVHAPLHALTAPPSIAPNAQLDGEGAVALDDGVIECPVLRRLACDAEFQVVIEDDRGQPLRLGRSVREPSAAIARLVRRRDRECQFPSCGARRHTDVHHVALWSRGGRTDVDNLLLLCGFHHRLVHEHGWSVRRSIDGDLRWTRPDGTRYRAGPSPPADRQRFN